MLKMIYTASLFITMAFFMCPILANESNVTHNSTFSSTFFENMTTAVTTISTMTDVSANETDITQSSTTQEISTAPKLPDGKVSFTPPVQATSKPSELTATPREHFQDTAKTTLKPQSGIGDSAGIIILVVIFIVVLLAGIFCCVAHNRGRRFSVNLSSRPDEAQIPLSAVEPERPVETVTSNGLLFENTEIIAREAQAPEAKPEEQVEQKAESEKATIDASVNGAAPAADNPEDVPKQDIPEQSPTAPVEPSTNEKTDDEQTEGDASNKTSLESLKESNEANENNSNNSLLPQRGATEGEAFWDVSLDNMV